MASPICLGIGLMIRLQIQSNYTFSFQEKIPLLYLCQERLGNLVQIELIPCLRCSGSQITYTLHLNHHQQSVHLNKKSIFFITVSQAILIKSCGNKTLGCVTNMSFININSSFLVYPNVIKLFLSCFLVITA